MRTKLVISPFPGGYAASLICPPNVYDLSTNVTLCPLKALTQAACIPPSPPPITNTLLDSLAIVNSPSRPKNGFAKQVIGLPWNMFGTQPCKQAIHGVISSNFPSLALFGVSGSAKL